MSGKIENGMGWMVSGNRDKGEAPWRGVGEMVDGTMKYQDAFYKARLDCTVEFRELAMIPATGANGVRLSVGENGCISDAIFNEIPAAHMTRVTPDHGIKATVRVWKNHETGLLEENFLAAVGQRYHILQNYEMGELSEALAATGRARYETAGYLDYGRIAWMLMNVEDSDIRVLDGDIVKPYLLVTTSHDGSSPLRACFTPVRVVCWNTLSMALGRAKNVVRIRHSASGPDRLNEARRVLKLAYDYTSDFGRVARELAQKQFTMPDMRTLQDTLYPATVKNEAGTGLILSGQAKQARLELVTLFENEAQRSPETAGTAWAAYNAVAERADYKPTKTDPGKVLESIWFGDRGKVKQEALEVICKMKDISLKPTK